MKIDSFDSFLRCFPLSINRWKGPRKGLWISSTLILVNMLKGPSCWRWALRRRSGMLLRAQLFSTFWCHWKWKTRAALRSGWKQFNCFTRFGQRRGTDLFIWSLRRTSDLVTDELEIGGPELRWISSHTMIDATVRWSPEVIGQEFSHQAHSLQDSLNIPNIWPHIIEAGCQMYLAMATLRKSKETHERRLDLSRKLPTDSRRRKCWQKSKKTNNVCWESYAQSNVTEKLPILDPTNF